MNIIFGIIFERLFVCSLKVLNDNFDFTKFYQIHMHGPHIFVMEYLFGVYLSYFLLKYGCYFILFNITNPR